MVKCRKLEDVFIPRLLRGFAFVMLSDGQVAQSLLGEKMIIKSKVYIRPVPYLSTVAIHSRRERAGGRVET